MMAFVLITAGPSTPVLIVLALGTNLIALSVVSPCLVFFVTALVASIPVRRPRSAIPFEF